MQSVVLKQLKQTAPLHEPKPIPFPPIPQNLVWSILMSRFRLADVQVDLSVWQCLC
jgi:hypothetical protein